jgi:hypothetical protein
MSTKPRIVCYGVREPAYLGVVETYARRFGLEVVSFGKNSSMFQVADHLKQAAFVFIWNGSQGETGLAARLCHIRQIPHVIFEQGLLPQTTTWLFDRMGYCGDSSLCGELDWVTDADLALLAEVRGTLQATHPIEDQGYILVPLQVHNDSQVLYHTGVNGMDELMQQVSETFPGRDIVVRPHPKSTARRESRWPNIRIEGSGTFLDWARSASMVVGLTSTCLYEAAILGKPVMAMGAHPLNRNRPEGDDHRDRMLAALLAHRVDRQGGDITPLLERFNLRPRGCAPLTPSEIETCSTYPCRTVSASTPSRTSAAVMPVGGTSRPARLPSSTSPAMTLPR